MFVTKKRVRTITWKWFKISSRNFIRSSRTITLAFILFELFHLGLSITKWCPFCNLKSVQDIFKKLYIISINIWRCAECKNHNSYIYTFWIISLGTLSQKTCLHYNLKPFKISSPNFIWISINIRWHAKRKNHYSCIYTFIVISLGIPLVNINVPWLFNTIWPQKRGDRFVFVDKQILVLFFYYYYIYFINFYFFIYLFWLFF